MKPDREWSGEKALLTVKKPVRRARRTHTSVFKARVALAARSLRRGQPRLPRCR